MQFRICVLAAAAWATILTSLSAAGASIPQGTPVHVEIDRRTAMRVGQPIAAHTVEPIYVATDILIPAGTKVTGDIRSLTPDNKTRRSARFDGDFTPLNTPTIQFTTLILSGDRAISIKATTATRGAPQITIRSTPAQHVSLIRQVWNRGVDQLKQTTDTFTAPGKKERLTDFLYNQLPYHPQRIKRDTQWTFDLTSPLEISPDPHDPKDTQPAALPAAQLDQQTDPNMLRLHAYLAERLDSASSTTGARFEAVVTQPLYAAAPSTHSVEVPVGSILVGQVTEATPAKRFGRDGKLRFIFRELKLPEQQEHIQGTVAAATADKNAALALDPEGGFKPAQRSRLVDPLILGLLASRALDGDGEQIAKDTVSSNGFGLAGRIAGIASGGTQVAAGFGFYALAVSVYRNYIARGKDVAFARGTRLEIEAVPAHGAPMPIH